MSISVLFLVIAMIIFALGAWSRWWVAPNPYYPTFVCMGLFFYTLAQLWPVINK